MKEGKTMNFIISIILGYGLGCFQTSYLISRYLLKEDVRTKGNGNAGASNMTVAYGKKMGLFVALIDMLKATAAIMIGKNIFMGEPLLNTLLYVIGLFVIVGHNFPFYMGFKGGKGTASLAGMLFGLNVFMGCIGVVIAISATLISDYIVIGTFSLLLAFNIMTYFLGYGMVPLLLSIVISLLSVYKHRENIELMIKREERSVRETLLKKKDKNNGK